MRLLVRDDYGMCVYAFHAVSLLFTQTTVLWRASSSDSILLGLAADLCVAFHATHVYAFHEKCISCQPTLHCCLLQWDALVDKAWRSILLPNLLNALWISGLATS